jgi:hypothetical protein
MVRRGSRGTRILSVGQPLSHVLTGLTSRHPPLPSVVAFSGTVVVYRGGLFCAWQIFGSKKCEEEYRLFSRLSQEQQLQQQLEAFTNSQAGKEKPHFIKRLKERTRKGEAWIES